MEHQEETTQPELIITEDIRSYIYDTSKWARFLSIVGMVMAGLTALAAFATTAMIASMNAVVGEAANPYAKMGSGLLTFIMLLVALLYFYPSLLLFKYSSSAKSAVLYGDQASLTGAMSKMKSFFKFWGILTIFIICCYFLAIIFGIVVGLSAGAVS